MMDELANENSRYWFQTSFRAIGSRNFMIFNSHPYIK